MVKASSLRTLINVIAILIFNLVAPAVPYFFKSEASTKEAFWNEDDTTYTREIQNNCLCGTTDKEKGSLPWFVYIYVKQPDGKLSNCTGTIIASNLLVTSHECLIFIGRKINVFDMWDIASTPQWNLADTKDIVVSASPILDNDQGTTAFTVERIIYNIHYVHSIAIQDDFPKVDVALIVVKENLLKDHTPICLPNYQDESQMSKLLKHSATESQRVVTENVVLTSNDGFLEGYRGHIFDFENCNKGRFNMNSMNKINWLCFGFWGLPLSTGAPLIYESTSGGTFLLGLSLVNEKHKEVDFKWSNFVFFTNTYPLIKYFEYHASIHGSQWCKTPSLTTNSATKPVVIDFTNRTWPWDSLETPIKRDERLKCYCGIQNGASNSRIAGGVTATAYEFGWMALIYIKLKGKWAYCGGSIINDRVILTAAHCLVKLDPKDNSRIIEHATEDLLVYLHAHKRRNDPTAKLVKVKSSRYHPNYIVAKKKDYFDYDIGVLILDEPLTFTESWNSDGIRPLCLPSMGADYMNLVGLTSTVAGWGLMDPTDDSSSAGELQKIQLPIRELKVCSDVAVDKVTERFICAGTLDKFKDSASGDSGGPLTIQNDKKQWIGVGIVSWAQEISYNNGKVLLTAALYTDVQKLISFVDYHSKSVEAEWCKSDF